MREVVINRLNKYYGPSAHALKNIDLEVDRGEFIVLVGPSGCGKTTLLRTIAGLEEATSGDILIGGRRVNDLEPAERDIAMVFQDYALYPHMSVRENLSFGLKQRKMARQEIDARIEEAVAMLGLGTYLDRKPSQLSGGQRQRVAIGRALVKRPKVFLFDEPLSNLDAQLRSQTRIELAALHRRLGSTSIYVTHDQVEAMTLADRIVVLEAGRIRQVGAPLEIYARPANTFVARFIGSPGMNLLEGDLRRGPEGRRELAIGRGPSLLFSRSEAPERIGPVILGVRAENVRLGEDGDLAVQILQVEPHGHESHVLVELSNGTTWHVRMPGTYRPSSSRVLALQLDRNALHWFSVGGEGERIAVQPSVESPVIGPEIRP